MMPFSIECPSCYAKLKIQSEAAIGKRVRCPRCDNAVTVQAPDDGLAETAEQNFNFDDDFGAPPPPPGGRTRRASSTKTGSRKKKSGRKAAAAPAWQKPAIIGGAVIGVCLLVGLLFMAFGGGGNKGSDGNVVDMTYLPHDANVLAHWNVQPFLQNPRAQTQLKSDANFQNVNAEMKTRLGVNFDDVESVTLGLTAPTAGGGEPENATVVIRLSKSMNTVAVKSDVDVETLQHGGQEYHMIRQQRLFFFMPDAQTIVGGDEAAVKAALDRGTESPRREQFDFIDSSHGLFAVFAPEDKSILRNSTGMTPDQVAEGIPLPQLQEPVRTLADVAFNHLSAGGVAMDLDSGKVKVSLYANCDSSAPAGRATDAGQKLIGELKTFAQGFVAMMPTDGQTLANEVLDSINVRQDGNSMVLALAIPEDADERMRKMGPGGPGGPGGGMPFPLPFDNPFENLNPFGAVGNARKAAQRTQGKNNLKQIGLAMHNYHDTFRSFPVSAKADPSHLGKNGKPKLSWRVHLLPFLEERALYEQFKLDEPWNSPHNIKLLQQMPEVYKDPQATGLAPGKTTYLTATGKGGMWEDGKSRRLAECTDGASNTAMVIDVPASLAVEWTKPDDFPFEPSAAGQLKSVLTLGRDGFNVLFGDGSVQYLAKTIDAQTVLRIFQRNDGQPVMLSR